MTGLSPKFVIALTLFGAVLLTGSDASAQEPLAPSSIRSKAEDVFSRPEFKRTDRRRPGSPDTDSPSDGGNGGNGSPNGKGSSSAGKGGSSGPSSENRPRPRRSRNQDSEPVSSPTDSDSGGSSPAIGALFGGLGTVLMWAVIIVVAVLLIVFVVSVLLKMKREPKPEVQAVQPAPAKDPEAAARRAWLSANYFAEAKARATLGDYTEAIRFLFLALVFRFDEEGRVGFHKEYTNREYLDLLGDQRKVRTSLGLLVDTLDVHWYGQQACTRQQYEECLEVYGRLAE